MGKKAGEPWEYQTDAGTLIFDRVEELFSPILNLLRPGERPAWELEKSLAAHFNVSKREQLARLRNGHRAWENHVAWALSRLTRRRSVTKLRTKTAPDGGRRGIYRANA